MNKERFHHALDFTETVAKTQTVQDAEKCLGQLAADFGFSIYVLATFTGPGSLTDPYLLASGWNDEWQDRYLGRQYIVDDPVVLRAARGSDPFLWNDSKNDPGVTPRGLEILEEARSFSLNNGVFIPVYGAKGMEGSLALGGEHADLGPDDMKALHLAGLYVYAHTVKIAQTAPKLEQDNISLTNREIECLKWTAAGKTSSDIASILGISRHTADWYLKEATLKLGTGNRTHAVAEAMRLKFIA
ncbi:LuxR family transcriptional regulator [Roseibium polysiphoniae]|nr:LuxR family transcriptional regulator [Roseibium polysiphoniae]